MRSLCPGIGNGAARSLKRDRSLGAAGPARQRALWTFSHGGCTAAGKTRFVILVHPNRVKSHDKSEHIAIHDIVIRGGTIVDGLGKPGFAPDLKADINLIDFAGLRMHAPEILYDLPADGRRLVQCADGYAATLLAGMPILGKGELTGAMPGCLVRG